MNLIEETDRLREEINKKEDELEKKNKEFKDERDKEKKVKLKSEVDKVKKERNKLFEDYLNKYSEGKVKEWISKDIEQETILYSEFFGRYSVIQDLSTSQIRNVYGEVKRIQMKTGSELDLLSLRMLQPKLAYAAARAKKTGTNELKNVLTASIKTVLEEGIDKKERDKRFENFANFFESILAYHKAYGGN